MSSAQSTKGKKVSDNFVLYVQPEVDHSGIKGFFFFFFNESIDSVMQEKRGSSLSQNSPDPIFNVKTRKYSK